MDLFVYLIIVGFSMGAGLLVLGLLGRAVPEARVQEAEPAAVASDSVSEQLRRGFTRTGRRRRMSAAEKARRQQEQLAMLTILVNRFIPSSEDNRAADRDWLVHSGLKIPPQTFWAFRVLCTGAGAVVGVYGATYMNGLGPSAAMILLCIVLGSQVPTFYVFSHRAKWRAELDRSLPDALDLMTVAVSAGTTLEASLRIVSERMDGALAQAFADIVEESRYGSRGRALVEFARRSGVPSFQIFAASLAQAEAAGAPLLDVLKEQAANARTLRRLELEQKANELQIKVMLPMIGCIFPVLIIMLVAPLVPLLMDMFG